jgi:uncharacterized membrane protein
MSLPVLLALGALLLSGLSDFLYKRAQLHGARPAAFLVVQSVFFNANSFLLALLTGGLHFEPTTLVHAIPAGVLLFSSLYCFMRSLRGSDATVNVPIYRLSFVVTTVLAVLLFGETLPPTRLLALGLAIVGILALADLRKLASGSLRPTSFAYLLAATTLYGISAAIYRASQLALVPPGSFLVVQAIVFLACGLVLLLTTERKWPTRAAYQHAPFTGLLLSTAFFLLLGSLRFGEASVGVPISQLSFVFTSLLAVVFLGERLDAGRIVGTVAAILAVLTFNLPGNGSH